MGSRTPEELGAVDWAELWHAYGSARDVPDLIRDLHSGDAERIGKALDTMDGRLLHQGTVYPATAAAVPFLVHAVAHLTRRRDELLLLIAGAAGERETRTGVAEEARARVAACVPELLPFLADDDQAVRRAAVRVASLAAGDTVPEALRRLVERYAADPDPEVRADALTALTLLDPDREAAGRRLREALEDGSAILRAAAALALMELSGPPFPAEWVRVLAEAAADGPAVDSMPFPGLGAADDRGSELLKDDPEAALTVARHWIRGGDAGGRGSRLASELADTWRDRQDDVLELLTEALPRQRDPWRLDLCLRTVAWWLPSAARPHPRLADLLFAHAVSDHRPTAAAAQLALGRMGDDRFLVAVETPAPQALIALAARTGRPDHQRRALRTPDVHRLGELLVTLTAPAVSALLTELKDLLRARRGALPLARRFGRWGVRDAELDGLLAEAAGDVTGDNELAVAAAVARARLGGPVEPALHLLELRLDDGTGAAETLREAGCLGPAAAGLLPRIAVFHDARYDWDRMRAAEAQWRITGDPSLAVPALSALAGPSPAGVAALRMLGRIGIVPDELRPGLRIWADSPRRLMETLWEWVPEHLRADDDVLRETASRLLGEGGAAAPGAQPTGPAPSGAPAV
ncbi:HEAT repeat domain-containing protein [Streptomyces sp. NPDC026673]|uniref:HEAT repeat domain-containing protein n=1 Tax=Streptomyces sp. NPDC026673 TaxID=3155724 RepID=UPI0033F1FE43